MGKIAPNVINYAKYPFWDNKIILEKKKNIANFVGDIF